MLFILLKNKIINFKSRIKSEFIIDFNFKNLPLQMFQEN